MTQNAAATRHQDDKRLDVDDVIGTVCTMRRLVLAAC